MQRIGWVWSCGKSALNPCAAVKVVCLPYRDNVKSAGHRLSCQLASEEVLRGSDYSALLTGVNASLRAHESAFIPHPHFYEQQRVPVARDEVDLADPTGVVSPQYRGPAKKQVQGGRALSSPAGMCAGAFQESRASWRKAPDSAPIVLLQPEELLSAYRN